MKKAVFSLLLALLVATPVYATTFTDVSSSDADYAAISNISARGIASGPGDGTFGPDRSVTRAEATKFIARTVGLDCSAYTNTEPDFTDTASSYGLKEYIACFKELGFASGYGDGRFGPQNEVLGPEFLKMLYRAAGIEIPNTSCSGMDESSCTENLYCIPLYSTASCPEGEFCTQSMEFSGCENLSYADLADSSLVPYVATAIRDGIRHSAVNNRIGNESLLRRDVARYLYNFINYVEANSPEGTYDVPEANNPEATYSESRTLLLPNENGAYCSGYENCTDISSGVNHDPATTVVNYRNQENGISIDLPYNPDWGSTNYRVNPYDQLGSKVYFGPLYGLVWRKQTLSFEDVMTTAEVMQEYSAVNMVSPYSDLINGIEVVKFADSGMVSKAYLIVIGDNYNYLLSSEFSSGSVENEFEELENIVETIQFI